jgi:ketopantoate reductase
LIHEGHEITVVTRAPHLDALRARGALVVRDVDGTELIAPVTPPHGAGDLAIVTTKSQHTLQAAQSRESVLAPGTILISVQHVGGHLGPTSQISRPPSRTDGMAWSPFQTGRITGRAAASAGLAGADRPGAAPRTAAMRVSAAE